MKNYFILCIVLFVSCKKEIKKVRIHTQVWMVKNLDVETFANGDKIPEAKTEEEWLKAAKNKQPAWCYYNNNPANGEIYGKLYNWYAATNKRGIAPKGWHVPRLDEWKILIDNLGGAMDAGIVMKDSVLWEKGKGSNESGFSSIPSGYRNPDNKFYLKGRVGGWWTVTAHDDDYAWAIYNASKFTITNPITMSKGNGVPIRCIKN